LNYQTIQAPGFSIVLCTHNGVNRLGPTLRHIAKLAIPANFAVELIIVNNASTDDTEGFTSMSWKNLGNPFPLIIANENRPGKGYAVETGYDRASYSYILTVDDDNWLKEDYLLISAKLFESDAKIGILQGKSDAVFEEPPPEWIEDFLLCFVIGSPRNENGYFAKNDFYIWGAGMVIRNADWKYLRNIGFSFLTSKVQGKAAGEDHEIAIALLMLGRKIWYSDQLKFKHYMPANRINWNKLKQNFDTWGYVNYYRFLYILVLESYHKKFTITNRIIKREFLKFSLRKLRHKSVGTYCRFFVNHNEKTMSNGSIRQNFGLIKSFTTLSKTALADTRHLQIWMFPILQENPHGFFLELKDSYMV
jgi:glycosyltransferase involved in cell wall biosynthesis